MQTQKAGAVTSDNAHAEPLNMTRRIGSTTYVVAVHFSRTSNETVEDKLIRLMEREVKDIA
jgi:hypothetical protein